MSWKASLFFLIALYWIPRIFHVFFCYLTGFRFCNQMPRKSGSDWPKAYCWGLCTKTNIAGQYSTLRMPQSQKTYSSRKSRQKKIRNTSFKRNFWTLDTQTACIFLGTVKDKSGCSYISLDGDSTELNEIHWNQATVRLLRTGMVWGRVNFWPKGLTDRASSEGVHSRILHRKLRKDM